MTWTLQEEDILHDYFPIKGALFCAKILHKSSDAVRKKAERLGIQGPGICAKSHEDYELELLENEIECFPIEKYINARTAIEHECIKGHIWKITPAHVLRGTGCPMCAKKGVYNETLFKHNPDLANSPGVLYCVVLVDKNTLERVCIKIGITKGSSYKAVNKRAIGFKGYDIRIQKIVLGTIEEVYHLEQWLHEMWSHKKYKSAWKFGGHTELFELDDEIIKSIPTNV